MNLAYLLDPVFQIEGVNGKPLVDGYIEVYHAGTDAKYVTYQSFDGVKNPFKVPLSADGRATLIAESTQHYDIYVYDSFSNLICSRKNVSCVGFVSVVNRDNVQVVTYGVTKWSDIDFTKSLMLRYIYRDTVVSSATYTCTDTALKFYVDIENEVYVVQLLHDSDAWSATKVDASSVYEATWGSSLASLNSIAADVLVYTKQDDAVYMNSYRSNTEWRFTQIDGDVINEATATANGWTENAISIADQGNVVLYPSGVEKYTFDQLATLTDQGRLYVKLNSSDSNIRQATYVDRSNKQITLTTPWYRIYTSDDAQRNEYLLSTMLIRMNTVTGKPFVGSYGDSYMLLSSDVLGDSGIKVKQNRSKVTVSLNYTTIEVDE